MKNTDSADAESSQNGDMCPGVTGTLPEVENACCKVGRVSQAYGLDGVDTELQRRREEDDATLHELATYFNERLTAVSLDAADVDIDAEPGTVHAALQGSDEIDITRRDEIRETVAGSLAIDRLQTDYTSHETVRKHLNQHLGISTSRGSIQTKQDLQEALSAYERQYEAGIVNALERAASQGIIAGGGFGVFSTRVECQACSSTYRLEELLSEGGCDCEG